ncbi:metal-dependent transcriptional regulator [Corynebacterium breve]|uniref:Diphtheria toxin repressor n=1 Tax=Corynebacterium breve TaxID=3049799 RepID=A0ABY8VHS2_9CORY|nr:metal-dependent transcriptional regulator [Corynebacterium breve]WIM68183.1 metal-dependent transcriptional regulator [Corynebacterium breve]
MHIRDLPDRTQDYIKVVWDITEYTGGPAALGEIAKRVGQKTSTASEAIKRLGHQQLVHHEPYAGVTLTPSGKDLALQMVRRHRLIETFLVRVLGYSWDEVHDDADMLEHGVSDLLLKRIDDYLGHPARDPHGDPIPDATGAFPRQDVHTLATIEPGATVTIAQVDDSDPELLRYLASHGLIPEATLTVPEAAVAGILQVTNSSGDTIPLSESSLGAIRVTR